VSGSNIGKHTN